MNKYLVFVQKCCVPTGVGSGVYSGNILLDNLQSEDADVSMPGGELPPGEALSRELFW